MWKGCGEGFGMPHAAGVVIARELYTPHRNLLPGEERCISMNKVARSQDSLALGWVRVFFGLVS